MLLIVWYTYDIGEVNNTLLKYNANLYLTEKISYNEERITDENTIHPFTAFLVRELIKMQLRKKWEVKFQKS